MRFLRSIYYFIVIGWFASADPQHEETELKLSDEIERIVIKGQTYKLTKWFFVELAKTPNVIGHGVPLLLQFDFENNTLEVDYMKIGHDQNAKYGQSPIYAGDQFRIEIGCQDRTFNIKINEKDQLNFTSALPVSLAKYLTIRGAHVDFAYFVSNKPIWAPFPYLSNGFKTGIHVIGIMPHKFKVGETIVITGQALNYSPTPVAIRGFAVDLVIENRDSPLHVKIEMYNGRDVIGISTYAQLRPQSWIAHSLSSPSPVRLGEKFRMKIVHQPQGFEIDVNGAKYSLAHQAHDIRTDGIVYFVIHKHLIMGAVDIY